MDGIREGRIFVTLGDLISELHVTAQSGDTAVDIGGELHVQEGDDVEVTIRFLDPVGLNWAGQDPAVHRVDLIAGQVTGPAADRSIDTNPTTRVLARFSPQQWRSAGSYQVMSYRMNAVAHSSYLRIRGTNGQELEPAMDPAGEDPWSDLWFYSNPIFIVVD
jgi:hypothetical protein